MANEIEICEFIQGHFFCVLPKGHSGRHEGFFDEECNTPEGPCTCEIRK